MHPKLLKTAASLLVLILASGLLAAPCFADGLELSSKHVCIVYDDSGSMYEKDGAPIMNWARANYMVQAFCALLNPEDSLYITYMSDIEGSLQRGDYLAGDRARSIAEIRSWRGDAQTPFAAVESAYDTLRSIEGRSGDEYWLVVMTDGKFQGMKGDLTETLKDYIDDMALAGKTLKVVFLAMGGEAEPPQADDDKGLAVYKTDEYGIITTMLALSDNISARQAFAYSDLRVDGSRIQFTSRIAPASLVILNQDSGNPVQSVENTDGLLKPSAQYAVSAPETFAREKSGQAVTDEALSGIITHYTPHSGYLAHGSYTVTFQNQVDIQKIRILYQPAITLQFRYMSAGKIVENPKDGDTVDIEVQLVNSATGKPFDASVLGEGLEYSLKLLSQGEVLAAESSPVLKDAALRDGDTAVAAEVVMPGYFTLRARLDYTEQQQAPEEHPGNAPAESSGPWPPEITLSAQPGPFASIRLKDLEKASFKLIPYYNGSPATAQNLENSNLEITCPRNVNFSYSVSPEGSYEIRPLYGRDMLSTSTGMISVTFIYTSEYQSMASATMAFYIEDMSWVQRNIQALWLPFALGAVAILICGILFFHKKFPKGGGIEYSHLSKDRMGKWQQSLPTSVAGFSNLKGNWIYIPFSRERITVSGITFYPGANDQHLLVWLKDIEGEIFTDPSDALVKKGSGFFVLKAGVSLTIERGCYQLSFRYIAPRHSLIQK